MRLLLDTHTLIWWSNDSTKLSGRADAAISSFENRVFVSSVSAFEIATKHRLGKLPEADALAGRFVQHAASEGFELLAIDAHHAQAAGALALPHRDPFDRLLIAQAMIEGMTLVSNELVFDAVEVQRLW